MLQLPKLVAILLAGLLLAGCKDVLFSRLSEAQANEVMAALAEARIDGAKARIDDEHWQVDVDAEKIGAALIFLRNRGVPAQQSASLGDVFKKDGFISSPMEERARFAFALQEGIAATLRRIDGVADARVHVAIPHNDPLSQRVVPASASVFVKYRRSLDIELLKPNIKSLVMAGVEGLDYRNISLLVFPVDGDLAQPAPRTAGLFAAQAAATRSEPLAAGAPAAGANALEWSVSLCATLAAASASIYWMRKRRVRTAAPTPPEGACGNAARKVPPPDLRPAALPGLFDTAAPGKH